MQISQISIPENSLIVSALSVTHYSDCFYFQFYTKQNIKLDDCIRYFFYNWPKWAQSLMKFRNILVKPLGLQTGTAENKKQSIPMINVYKGGRVAFFDVLECNNEEVLLYASDKHLEGCFSILLRNSFNLCEISISTIVKFHNVGGRIYFFFIKPFHILIVRSMIHRVAKHFSQNYKTK